MLVNDIAIIGGGVTGLALAHGLARRGRPVTVFEKEEKCGGLAASFAAGSETIDRYYHHIFNAHDELLDVIRSLGLDERLAFKKAAMAYYSRGRIYPFNGPLDLLRFRPLSVASRLRVGISASAFLLNRKWQDFDGMTAAALLKRRCGDQGYALFWHPLLKNKFGAHASAVSATWLWDRLQSRTRGRLGRSSGALGYLRGGFRPLFAEMEAEIERRGGRILTGRAVAEIAKAGPRGPWILNGDPASSFQTCIVTLPLPRFIKMVPALPQEYRERLAGIDYSHSVCMILRLSKPLSSFYWINVGDEEVPFAVIVEHTNWMGGAGPRSPHVVYLSRYCDRDDDFSWSMPDHKLFAAYCGHLQRMFPGFAESQVLGFHVCRDLYTQPIFKAHYAKVRPPFATPLPDLFLVNASQFYPRSRCLNTSFVLAQEFLSHWLDREARR